MADGTAMAQSLFAVPLGQHCLFSDFFSHAPNGFCCCRFQRHTSRHTRHMPSIQHPHKELILGGQRSGKSARAEQLAAQWLAQSPTHRALFLATAQAHDDEMRQRIIRHQQDRALRLPGIQTIEGADVAAQLLAHSHADTAIVLDCLTLWLTQLHMPWQAPPTTPQQTEARTDALLHAIASSQARLFIVSNEIGLGVIAPAPETRRFVDALGRLNQRVAAVCSHVTFMAAGLPLPLKHP